VSGPAGAALRQWRLRVVAVVGLALAAAGAVPAQPDGLHIRTGDRESVIPWVTSDGVRYLPLKSLATALGGSVQTSARSIVLDACGVSSRFVRGQRSVEINGTGMETLGAAVTQGAISGTLVPADFITDILPRYGTGIVWDAEEKELRRFSTFARRTPSALVPSAPVAGDPPSDLGGAARGDAPVLRPDADARPVRIGGGSPRAAATTPVPRPAGATDGRRRGPRRVVIDPGHGGPDNGMSGTTVAGTRVFEKQITLGIALKVADALRAEGITVHLTRTRDTLIALSDRGRIANTARADLFLSIHVNAANPRWRDATAARGFETYFLAEAKTEDESRVERMENEAVRFETGANAPRGDPLSFIINDMAQNEHLREASDLAGEVQRRLRATHPGTDRGVKQANFSVLRGSFMPAVLIEVGFGTNRAEATYLTTPARQMDLAAAISAATIEYLARYERRVSGGSK
jgi:N-acetylmuramoyl-L-alanine amidase